MSHGQLRAIPNLCQPSAIFNPRATHGLTAEIATPGTLFMTQVQLIFELFRCTMGAPGSHTIKCDCGVYRMLEFWSH